MNVDDLLPYILARAKGCPEPTATEAIITAAREFCERTRVWRNEATETISATGEITPTLPAGSVLHDVDYARLDDGELTSISVKTLDETWPGWRTDTSGNPKHITQLSVDKLRLVPETDSGSLFLSLILKPAYGATTLPDFIGTQYRKAIRHGALAEIFAIPGDVFTNPALSQANGVEFLDEIGRYLNAGTKGQIRARRGVKARFF